MTTQHNREGERAKQAGEVTEGLAAWSDELATIDPTSLDVELKYSLFEFRNAPRGSLIWHAFEMTRYTHSFIGQKDEPMFVKVANYNLRTLRFIQLWTLVHLAPSASAAAVAEAVAERDAKLAGEVTEGDRALWESLCRLNACAANVEDYQEESVALIAKFRASVAVAEAESKVTALESLVVRLKEALKSADKGFLEFYSNGPKWDGMTIEDEAKHWMAKMTEALALVPADLSDCVCVKRSEWYGSGFPEMKREVEQLRYDVSKLEVENKRLLHGLREIQDFIWKEPSDAACAAYSVAARLLEGTPFHVTAALQPAPKV